MNTEKILINYIKHLGFIAILCLMPWYCYAQEVKSDREDLSQIQQLMENFQTYGTFTVDFQHFSDSKANKFLSLFESGAIIYNPFTIKNETPETFALYCKQNFTNGLYLEFSTTFIPVMTLDNERQRQFTIETELQVIGIFQGRERKELIIPLLISIKLDAASESAIFSSILKRELRNIGNISIQLVNVKNPDQILSGIPIALEMHDSIFQQVNSNQNGIVTFSAVPFRDAYKVSVNAESYQYKKLLLIPEDTSAQRTINYYLPLVPITVDPDQYFSIGILNSALFVQFDKPVVNDSMNYEKLSGLGYQTFFNMGFSQKLLQNGNSRLFLETGLQFEYSSYSIETSNLVHRVTSDTTNWNNIWFTANKLDFYSDKVNLNIPLHIAYQYKISSRFPSIFEIGGGVLYTMQLINYYNQQTAYTISKTLTPHENHSHSQLVEEKGTTTKKRYQAFTRSYLQYELFAGIKHLLPNNGILLGARIHYRTSFIHLKNKSQATILGNNFTKPIEIPKLMDRKNEHQFGMELSVSIPIHL